MPFIAYKDDENQLILSVPGGDWNDTMRYSDFEGRYEHILYVSLSPKKTMCVAYAFKNGPCDLVAILWGASIMTHRAGSPPKRDLRSTALARVKKCPAHKAVTLQEFGATLVTGKAFHRKTLFKRLVRKYGVKGARIDKI